MTGANLLTRLTVLINNLRVTSGGADEVRALAALDMAQDFYESVAAAHGGVRNGSGSLATVANTETSAWPSGLLRLDSLWMLNNSGKQIYELRDIHESGGHGATVSTPLALVSSNTLPGQPKQYWTIPYESVYWAPEPDAVYTTRYFGYVAKTDLTSRSVTFGHPNIVSVPLVAFAGRLLEMGVDDPTEELQALAEETFLPVVRLLSNQVRARGRARQYSRTHTT